MSERPILFSAPMVRAILDGRKTQTRRVVKSVACAQEAESHGSAVCPYGQPGGQLWVRESFQALFADGVEDRYQTDYKTGKGYRVYYMATDARQEFVDAEDDLSDAITPSIFMPRWASRITLAVTAVRVERLQEISEANAVSEGMRSVVVDGTGRGPGCKWNGIGYEGARPNLYHAPDGDSGRCCCKVAGPTPAQCAYRDLWDSINTKRAPWASNPWVWVVEFKRLP